MVVRAAAALSMSGDQRAELCRMARSSTLPHRKVLRAKALLWAADGVANEEIARRSGVDGVGVIAKGRGRKPRLAEGMVAEVVRVTQHEQPLDGATHWTTRSLARRFGIGKDAVAQIWADHQLEPWKVWGATKDR